MEIDRGRGRPDNNEPRDQRDASPKSPIDLVEYSRRKEKQEENFLSPEDNEFLNGFREYLDSKKPPEIDMDKLIARMRAVPLHLGKDWHPDSILEQADIDLLLNQNRNQSQKTIVDFQAHKERRQRQESQPPQNKE